jgi:predicted aldo/keto reductase-like oxidoreductase
MHMLNDAETWQNLLDMGIGAWIAEKKASGAIRQIGFSYHGNSETFCKIVDAYDWDFCQIQYNYLDEHSQAGRKGLLHAAEKGIPVIIMEPLRGGRLVGMLPESAKRIFDAYPEKRSYAEWGLRWVANHPEVLCILSGMSAPEQLAENLRIMDEAAPNSLTEAELSIIDKASDEYNKLIQYSCTECRYCMPCPMKIDIPDNIGYYNEWFLYDKNPKVKADFFTFTIEGRRASACVECKACEEKCPQHLPIAEIMKKTADLFEK